MAATIATALTPAVTADARQHGRCHSAACVRRVQAKIDARQPMRTAIASFYGVADSGGALACGGGNLTDRTLGVANKVLPCGKRIRVCARRCIETHVIDRGPFVAGREFDLTIATARAIGFNLAAGYGPIRVSAR